MLSGVVLHNRVLFEFRLQSRLADRDDCATRSLNKLTEASPIIECSDGLHIPTDITSELPKVHPKHKKSHDSSVIAY